jgi:hypothetical protein
MSNDVNIIPLDGTVMAISRVIMGYTTTVENLKKKYQSYSPGNSRLFHSRREFEMFTYGLSDL